MHHSFINVSHLTPHLLWFLFQKSSSSASSEASETCQSVSECSSPTTVSIKFSVHKTFVCWNCQRYFGLSVGPVKVVLLIGKLGSTLSLLPVSSLCCHQIWSSLPVSACICKATHTKAPMPMSKGKGVSCYSDGLDLISPFRSLARPSLPSALLSLTLAPSDLSLSYFLRPHPITAPLDPTHPLPHPRFLAGRFVSTGNSHCSFVHFLFFWCTFLCVEYVAPE